MKFMHTKVTITKWGRKILVLKSPSVEKSRFILRSKSAGDIYNIDFGPYIHKPWVWDPQVTLSCQTLMYSICTCNNYYWSIKVMLFCFTWSNTYHWLMSMMCYIICILKKFPPIPFFILPVFLVI